MHYKYTNQKETIIIGTTIMGLSVLSILSGYFLEPILFLSVMPILWLDKSHELNDQNMVTPQLIEQELATLEENVDDLATQQENVDDLAIQQENTLESHHIEISTDFKQKICNFSDIYSQNPVCKLPNYNCNNNYDELIYYFSKNLPQTSFLKSQQLLEKVDPRIFLKITNKQYNNENYQPQQIIIPVRVKDSIWFGAPSSNTLISSIDDIAHFYCMD